jgi:hypothetical protein
MAAARAQVVIREVAAVFPSTETIVAAINAKFQSAT